MGFHQSRFHFYSIDLMFQPRKRKKKWEPVGFAWTDKLSCAIQLMSSLSHMSFLSTRACQPLTSSDHFCLLHLSLSQISLQQLLHTHKPSPAKKFKSERIPKRISKRIPKRIQKNNSKNNSKTIQKTIPIRTPIRISKRNN